MKLMTASITKMAHAEKMATFPASTPSTFNRDGGGKEGAGGTTDQKGGNTAKYLYTVKSKITHVYHEGHRYRDVSIKWFCNGRNDAFVPSAGIVVDYPYGQDELRTDELLSEFFTEEEANALQEYLFRFRNIAMTRTEEVERISFRPTDGSTLMRLLDYQSGKGVLFPDGWDEEAFPFDVLGYYDVHRLTERKLSECFRAPCAKKD